MNTRRRVLAAVALLAALPLAAATPAEAALSRQCAGSVTTSFNPGPASSSGSFTYSTVIYACNNGGVGAASGSGWWNGTTFTGTYRDSMGCSGSVAGTYAGGTFAGTLNFVCQFTSGTGQFVLNGGGLHVSM